MIVKVEWTEHNRKYTIGIKQFLKELGLDIPDEQIQKTIIKLLNQNELEQTDE